MSDRDAAAFAGVVGGLLGAGVALPGGLRALADESESGRLGRGLRRVADRIERGESLAGAIEAEGARVPAHLPGIVRAAERSGRPLDVFTEAARFERMSGELARHVLGRLAYPTLLLCAFAAVVQLLTEFVTLDLVAIYEDFGVALPALTAWLVACSRWIDAIGWAIPAAIALALLLVWRVARGTTRSSRRRVVGGVPVLGRIRRDAAMAEFAGLLAILVDGRLAMPEALVLAGRGVRDPDLISACVGASREVEKGQSLLDASRAYRLFPHGFDRLLGWAEAHGALPDALRLASDVYAARVRALASALGIFLSTAAIALVVLGVLLIVVGIYLPLIKLISALTGGSPFLLF